MMCLRKKALYGVSIMVSCLTFQGELQASDYLQNAQKIISMEAENGVLSGGNQWVLNNGIAGASGESAVKAVSDNWDIGTGAKLDFSFTTHEAGLYEVLLRAKTFSGLGKSIWINLDGEYLSHSESEAIYFDLAGWQWTSGYDATLVSLAAGDHTLQLYVRTAGLEVDKIVIQPVGTSSEVSVGSNSVGPPETKA